MLSIRSILLKITKLKLGMNFEKKLSPSVFDDKEEKTQFRLLGRSLQTQSVKAFKAKIPNLNKNTWYTKWNEALTSQHLIARAMAGHSISFIALITKGQRLNALKTILNILIDETVRWISNGD